MTTIVTEFKEPIPIPPGSPEHKNYFNRLLMKDIGKAIGIFNRALENQSFPRKTIEYFLRQISDRTKSSYIQDRMKAVDAMHQSVVFDKDLNSDYQNLKTAYLKLVKELHLSIHSEFLADELRTNHRQNPCATQELQKAINLYRLSSICLLQAERDVELILKCSKEAETIFTSLQMHRHLPDNVSALRDANLCVIKHLDK